jgi:hypothetical protein
LIGLKDLVELQVARWTPSTSCHVLSNREIDPEDSLNGGIYPSCPWLALKSCKTTMGS